MPPAEPLDPATAEAELVSLLGRPELSSQLLETVPGGVVVVSLAGGIMHANAEAERLLGLGYEELTGRFVSQWESETCWEDGTPCPAADYPVSRCLATGERQGPVTIGMRRVGQDDTTWCVFNAAPLHAPREGQLLGAVVTFLDVTSRREAEQELQASRERYRLLVRSMEETVIVIDRAERILYINHVALGFSFEQVLGSPVRSFLSDPESFEEHSRVAFEEGQETSYTVETTQGRWYRTRIVPLERDPEGRVETAFLISSDITGQRLDEVERHRLEDDLARRVGELNVLAGGIAHDFSNVLQGILGSAELALRLLPSDHEARSQLEDIRTDARHAGDLPHQLLAYSGRGQVCVEPLDLEELLTSMWRLVRANVSRRAHLTLALHGGLPVVRGDATQLRQIVMNLATNASEALGGEDGSIVISTGSATLAEVQTQASAKPAALEAERYVVLEVKDEGCGMDEATRSRVFDPFFSTKSRTGRGLGLAAVYGIVRAHDGAVSVQSAPGEGTTIRVYFPANPDEVLVPSSERPALRATPAVHSGRVLVIEDEVRPRRVAQLALESVGYEVLVAPTGAIARQILEREHATLSLALVDLVLPDANGADLIGEIRELDPKLPVIACSGYQEGTFSIGTRDFLHGYLTKPYALEDLLRAVGKARR